MMRTGTIFVFHIFCLLLWSTGAVSSEEGSTVYFRKNGGVFSSADASLPERLESTETLRWRTSLDSGHSSPIVCNGKIFLTTFNPLNEELATLALDAESGEVLWKRIAPTNRIEAYNYATGNAAQATPACDGNRLYVFFGSFGLVCYNLDGKLIWEHHMGPFQDEYGSASSPVLVDGKVIIQQDHDVDSFLMALDSRSGRVLWKKERPNAARSYSTPAVWTRNGKKEVLVAGSLELSGYDPSDGKRLWRSGGLARIVIPTPVANGNTVYMASWSPGGDGAWRARMETWPEALRRYDRNGDNALSRREARNPDVLQRFFSIDTNQNGKLNQQEWEHFASIFQRARNGILAIRPPEETGGQDSASILWRHDRGAPYVATPLLDKGILWIVKDGGIVTKISADSGEVLQERRLPAIGNYYASPIGADGKVLFASERGVVSILADSPEWKVLSSHDFRERIYATPLVAARCLFIRTEKALYCFRETKP